jgi:predicted nuclease of predicted toxin-antitoxin system
VRLIIDAQLPPALADELLQFGCDAVALSQIGLRHAKDSVIWDYALQNQAAILTKDKDFAERCLRNKNAPVVVWLRIGNATNPTLLNWFMPMLPQVLA